MKTLIETINGKAKATAGTKERMGKRGGGRKFLAKCLSSSLSLSVGLPIWGEAIDVVRSAPQEAHYHADVIYLLS